MHTLLAVPGRHAPVLGSRPDPQPGPGEVVLAVIAAAVNPVDVMVASGALREAFGLEGEVGLGWDVTGRVVATGEGVTAPRVGEVVAALHTDLAAGSRTHAELVVVPARATALVPAGLDPVAAASVPLNALTAAQAVDLMGEPGGRSLLVTGAAGAVGAYAVALAVAAGWQVAGLARSHDAAFVSGQGAEALTATGGRTWEVVLDTAGMRQDVLGAVGDGGSYVGLLPTAPTLTVGRGAGVQQLMVQPDGPRLAALLDLCRSGELAVRVAGTVPLAEAEAAYAAVAAGGQRGRWLLLPGTAG